MEEISESSPVFWYVELIINYTGILMANTFEYTKLNLERTIQGLLTEEAEFMYLDTSSLVPKGKTYSVYYLINKNKRYFTNTITSKSIRELRRLKNFDIILPDISPPAVAASFA